MQEITKDVTCKITGSIMTIRQTVPSDERKGKFMKSKPELKKFPNVASLVRNARIKTGVSQSFVATNIDYENGQFISNVERGLCSIPDTKINVLCKLLDIAPNELVDAMVADHRANIEKRMK
jgi:ribosome-binding protein aMBF1 (putative translation factor)